MNKVAIYAICKNERQFVDKWLESMKEADYICVLDTGSDDDTYEYLIREKVRYPQLIVEQKVIDPWRFDTARNESLKLVPEDANILFCTDLDEVLEPGWYKPLVEKWNPKLHSRGEYMYAWSHLPDGSDGRVFKYNKIHDKCWKWYAAVHEFLMRKNSEGNWSSSYSRTNVCDLCGEIKLHHWPDLTKSRGSYLALLEERVADNDTDYTAKVYLANEYGYRGQYQKSIDAFKVIIEKYSDKFENYEVANFYSCTAEMYEKLNDQKHAEEYYLKAITKEPTWREPYLFYANLLNNQGKYDTAIGYIREALKKSVRRYVYIERDTSWNSLPYDLLSISYYYTGQYLKALACVDKALESFPEDGRLLTNREIMSNAISEKDLL